MRSNLTKVLKLSESKIITYYLGKEFEKTLDVKDFSAILVLFGCYYYCCYYYCSREEIDL